MEGSYSMDDTVIDKTGKIECKECGATYDEDMFDCPICGAPKGETGTQGEMKPPDDKASAEKKEGLLPAEEEVIPASKQKEEIILPAPAAETRKPEAPLPEEDKEIEREKLYKAAFAEVDRDWVKHKSKLLKMKVISSVEKGLLTGSLIIVVSNLVIYLFSGFLYLTGALATSFYEIYSEVFSVPYLFMALIILIIYLFRITPGITAEEKSKKTFFRVEGFALMIFLPPFIFVLNLFVLPVTYGMTISLIFLGAGMFFLWRYVLSQERDFPLWFSLLVGGLWLFSMVQAGVILRWLLVSEGTIPILPISYGYYLHFGIYDLYLILCSLSLVGIAYMNIRPMYLMQDSYDSSVRYAIEFYLGRAYDGAFTYFNRAIRIGEDIMRRRWKLMDLDLAWMGRGACEIEKGAYDEAIASLRMALKLNPANDTAWNLLGIALAHQGELDASLDAFRHAVEINPRYFEAYNNMGNILYLQGKFKDALKYYDTALDINRKYKDAWINKGYTYLKLGLHKDAIRCSNEAMKLEKGASYG